MPGPRPRTSRKPKMVKRKTDRRKNKAEIILLKRKGEQFFSHNVVLPKEKVLVMKHPIPQDLSGGHKSIVKKDPTRFGESNKLDDHFVFKERRKGERRKK